MATDPEEARREAALVDAVKDGDARAFETLLEAHEARVLRVLGLLGISIEDREDVAQEVFIRAFRHFDGFRPGRSFAGWIYRITVNAAHDHRGRLAKTRRAETAWTDQLDAAPDPGPGPGEQLEQRDQRRRLDLALDTLPERPRAVFVLCELEGLETNEVATFLGISRITVRRHLGRARRDLERTLREIEKISTDR